MTLDNKSNQVYLKLTLDSQYHSYEEHVTSYPLAKSRAVLVKNFFDEKLVSVFEY